VVFLAVHKDVPTF